MVKSKNFQFDYTKLEINFSLIYQNEKLSYRMIYF